MKQMCQTKSVCSIRIAWYNLQFLNYRGHASIIWDLSRLITMLLDSIDTQTINVTTEDSWDKNAGSDLLLVRPFDLKHAPICLNSDGCQSLLLPMFFCFTKKHSRQVSRLKAFPERENPQPAAQMKLNIGWVVKERRVRRSGLFCNRHPL